MQHKKGQAEIRIGNRVIHIPIHEELETHLLAFENSLKLDQMEMSRFLRGYLSPRMREVCLKIKDIEIDFSVSAWLADALELEIDPFIPEEEYCDDFGQIIRKMIPSSVRPPSEKQLTYAKRIAAILGKELTAEQISSVNTCGDFIDKHLPEFQEKQSSLRAIYTLARKAARGYAALCLVSVYGGITEKLLDVMSVTQKTTIDKYLTQFREFLGKYLVMEPHEQQVSISSINEFLQEHYTAVVLPELDEKMIEWLLINPQVLDIEEKFNI